MTTIKNKVKFAIIGAGSVSFCPATVADILLSEPFSRLADLEIFLMDVKGDAIEASETYCKKIAALLGRTNVTVNSSTDLRQALHGADFVITAVEVNRYYYWSMDFHIPRRYGFRQIYGENGGPGGMFHALRNMPILLNIAKEMERECPDAWMLNYSNPEAKLVEAVSRLTGIKAVGLCHGVHMGVSQLATFLKMPKDRISAKPIGLNHFGWFTKVWDKETGEDLYPKLREMENVAAPLAHWDEYALSRVMLRTYGLWPYPGANHIGEYIAWSDGFLASASLQFYYDPAKGDLWNRDTKPDQSAKGDLWNKNTAPDQPINFIYSLSGNPTEGALFPDEDELNENGRYLKRFNADTLTIDKIKQSGEYGIPIAEAIFFDEPKEIGAVNVPNLGYAKDLPEGMAIELPAVADGQGLHPAQCDALPTAVAAMIGVQGAIHKLLIEAYNEKSLNKLLQAVLLDPTISSYANAIAMINEMCERQKDILPPLYW